MNKILGVVFAAVIVAAAAGTAFYFHGHGKAPSTKLTTQVPADTLFYAGVDDWKTYWPKVKQFYMAPTPDQTAQVKKTLGSLGEGGRFLDGLYEAYIQQLGQDRFIPGTGKHPQIVAYTVGLFPVVRIALTDPAAFRQFIADAVKRGGAHPSSGSFKKVSYEKFPLQVDGKPSPASLIVAVRDTYAVIALETPKFRDQELPMALGLEAPKESLAKSGLIGKLAKAHGLDAGSLGYINQRSLVAALTDPSANLAGKMISQLDQQSHSLAPLQTSACQKDLKGIADIWPVTVFGVVKGSGGAANALDVRMVSEVTDDSLLKTLGELRGHVPTFLRNGSSSPLFGMAVGMDMSNVAPVVNSLWERFTNAKFECKLLTNEQQRLKQQNPAAIAMATAMLAGIKGASVTLFNLEMDSGPQGPRPKKIDGLVTISTEHPQALVATLKGMQPALANVQFPKDGSPVTLPLPTGPLGPVQAMVMDKAIAVFVGSQARQAADGLKSEKLNPNGLLYFGIDYGKLIPLAASATKDIDALPLANSNAADIARVKQRLQAMAGWKMRASETLDIGDKGIVMDVLMKQPKAQ